MKKTSNQKKTPRNKITQVQATYYLNCPMVCNESLLFNLCCLGFIRLGTVDEEGSFNGKFLIKIGEAFFKEGFTDVSMYQPLNADNSYDIRIYFHIKSTSENRDEEDEWFCITILNGRYRGGPYLRFTRDRGEVYHHDQTRESKYNPGERYNVGEKCIEHPLTDDGVEKMLKDIEITLKHRNDWW